MKRFIRRVLAGLLTFGLLSGGAAVCSPAQSARQDCCGKGCPAPKVPCAQMVCCRQVLPNAVVAGAPVLRAVLSTVPAFASSRSKTEVYLVASAPQCGPPERSHEAPSGRSPPV